ncbi:MAG: DUF2961 domain-containing protein, partial [Planctomycetes bacterium]|nr:DUF2961 domain-containing protein [Planctomycetota bacterium]
MRRTTCLAIGLSVLAMLGLPAARGGDAMDVAFFLDRMVDLSWLARPEPGTRCIQFSSYDRACENWKTNPESWRANGDAGKYYRIEPNGEAVMAEVDGPGVITNIWSANPQGILRFYFDGQEKPGLELSFPGMLPAKDGEGEFPFQQPFSYRISGANSYIPIPFAKGIKIVADKPHGQYYNIVARVFPKGTRVTTYSPTWTEEQKAAWKRAEKVLREPWKPDGRGRGLEWSGRIEAGATVTVGDRAAVSPAGEIVTYAAMKLSGGGRFAARMTRIRITWDGEDRPSVDCPVGDFFANTFWTAPYASRVAGFQDGWWYTRWPMPYKRALVTLENMGEAPVDVKVQAQGRPLDEPTSWRFHAKYRRENGCSVFDYPFLETKGVGRYVGVVMNIDCPWTGWWGEGDEKVWVDGEEFPSWWGTGSEDYFKDAWGMHIHGRPFEGCPILQGPGFSNKDCMYRWHILDSIPFERSFRITIENYADRNAPEDRVDYSSVAFWYQDGVSRDDFFAPYGVKDCIPRPRTRPGAIEAEDLEAKGAIRLSLDDIAAGSVKAAELASGTGALAVPLAESRTFTVSVPVPEGALRRVVLYLLPSDAKGSLRVTVAGEAVREIPDVAAAGETVPLGVVRGGAAGTSIVLAASKGSGRLLLDAIGVEGPRAEAGVIEAETLAFVPEAVRRIRSDASGWEVATLSPSGGAATVETKSGGSYAVQARILRGPDQATCRIEIGGVALANPFAGRADKEGLVVHIFG